MPRRPRSIEIVTDRSMEDLGAWREKRRRELEQKDADDIIAAARSSEPQWRKDHRPYEEEDKPRVGDNVAMASNDEVSIEISSVPDEQPYADQGIWIVVDQYDEEHFVEEDGQNGWLTLNPSSDIG